MFKRKVARSKFQAALEIGSVIYHMTARNARGKRGNAVASLLGSIGMSILLMLLMALIMIYGFSMRSSPIRGDYLMFMMSGIFMYMMHIRTFKAVSSTGSEVAGTMKHTQMSTPVVIASGALSALYTQILTILGILLLYQVVFAPLEILHPIQALGMVMQSWLTAVCIGILFLALTPWAPGLMAKLNMLYVRLNFLASGKMFLANTLGGDALPWFEWNPLFHIIDQTRGFVFVNYVPHYTNSTYALKVSFVVLVLGMMIEFVTRRSASASWSKKRI